MQVTWACSCLLILVIQSSILLPRMKMKKHPLECIEVQNAAPVGSHSYVLLNKAIVVSTDDGTALIVDSLVEKAFLRQVFFACLNISSCFACSFLCNPPPCQEFLQEVVVLSRAFSIQGFCFSSSSLIFEQIHYVLGSLGCLWANGNGNGSVFEVSTADLFF